jgi:hypothetical protein
MRYVRVFGRVIRCYAGFEVALHPWTPRKEIDSVLYSCLCNGIHFVAWIIPYPYYPYLTLYTFHNS